MWILLTAYSAVTAEIAQLGERQTEDLKVPGSIPGFGTRIYDAIYCPWHCVTRQNAALTGNRTPVSRVAGENSTTEPSMRRTTLTRMLRDEIKIKQAADSNLHCLRLAYNVNWQFFLPNTPQAFRDLWMSYRLKKYSHCILVTEYKVTINSMVFVIFDFILGFGRGLHFMSTK